MQDELLVALDAESVHATVLPDVRPISPILAELKTIDVRRAAGLERKDQLMAGAVEGAHPTVILDPHTEVLQFRVGTGSGGQYLAQVAPIHADEMDRALDAEGRKQAERRLQKLHKLGGRHFAGGHCEFAVLHPAEPAHIALDPHLQAMI